MFPPIFVADTIIVYGYNITGLVECSMLNGCVFVYELSGCGFESRCGHPNNGNEIKSDILPSVILKSDIIFHWSQNTKIF